MGANWSSDDFSSCSPAPTSRTSFPYQPSCISSSTPSLRISSAPSTRASMRSRLDRSVTPPLPLLAAPGPSSSSSGPAHLKDTRSTSTSYSSAPPPVSVVELSSMPIRIESKRSSATEMALSCPAVVAMGTPAVYSASSPSPRPISGLASSRPVNGPSPGPSPGHISGPVLGSARMSHCGPISESTGNRGPALGSSNSPTFSPARDSIHVPELGTTPSPAFRSAHGPTRDSSSLLAVYSTRGPALGSTHGSTQVSANSSNHSSAFGSTHGSIHGSTHGPARGSTHVSTFSPTHGSTQSPTLGSTHNPAFDSTHDFTHSPAPLPSSPPLSRDRTPTNEGPCAAGRPCSTSTTLITQSPSTPSPPPPTPPPPLEGPSSCSCGREVELLRNETRLLRTELTKSRQTIGQMKEREKLLRHRLSEQARRQIERGGSSKFEDISLGENRPSQLIRRYGNLYSDGRLDAMDALDELREVAEFTDLKEKLLLSVIVLAFRNARRNLEEMKSQVRHLLHISDQPPPPPPPPPPLPPHQHQHPAPSSSSASSSTSNVRDPAVTLKGRPLPPSHPVVVELEEIIAVYLRKTLEHQNLTRIYQEVRERVWSTLFDFPKLRFCRGLQLYIDDCVRLAWALSLQNPPYVVDYKAKSFSPDAHTRFHTSDPDSTRVRSVLWPALREGGDTGPCVYKGVVVT